MASCFGNGVSADRLDREAFRFEHRLMGHPALEMGNLARVIPRLPAAQVMYSTRQLSTADNFEKTFRERPLDRSIEETIETLRNSDAYIMVSSPQVDPSFRDVYQALIADVESLLRERGIAGGVVTPKLYLFIASPNSVTPFHIDRYSTFLMQFQGHKQVTVSAPFDERVVSNADCENYVSYVSTQLPWSPALDAYATTFDFAPGQALHIPFAAGHHVRNGPDDVSISMSIIFNTRETVIWREALRFNQRMRKWLGPLGIRPRPVGVGALRDHLKANAWNAWSRMRAH